MSKQKVTISLEQKTYSEFKDYCQENAIMLSRKIEIWIENFMNETKEKGGKK
jgi:hypothetical protein